MGDILFLAHRVPFPPDRGDKIRSFHLLRHLSARARVHLIAFADDRRDLGQEEALARFTASRSIHWRAKSRVVATAESLLSGRSVSVAAFADRALRRSVEQALRAHDIDTIFVFSSQMAQYVPANARQRVVMDFVDMDSAKFAAYAADAHGPMRWLLGREARLLRRHEAAVAARADASLFVSAAEAALFRDRTGAERIHVVENGIDTLRFDPQADVPGVDAPDLSIVFTGQMDYRPNVEGVTWFAEAVLPRLRRIRPEARFVIVGRDPTDSVRALARRPGVTVTGEVADVRGWLARAAVAVAPLRLARGIQNKVLEAMAMARPVVASPAAAEGIDHGGAIRVAAGEEAMADAILALLAHREAAEALGAAARRQVVARYGWDARLAPLDAILGLASPEAPERSAA